MIPRRIWLTAFTLLLLLQAGAWAISTYGSVTDLRVINQSGAAVTGLRVCFYMGKCVQRDDLRNNKAWRVSLKIEGDGGAILEFDQQTSAQRSSTYITRGLGVHWLILPGGRVEQKQ
ncbi:hypothetical protein E7T06_00925 [Deinococcus sp. Arct2-2]|uniref:hypothetical protein n=1 Tax=Deinococcus sp. Arct2-2 TaxID=2568653 RepID=UPI0010A51F1C|nr:hypothetical protein [Deinococcus sp. Arct2-2]THF71956.1 hypothetical protein E7T06_00925 [Deinococcus sp. Arct2-2]